jgi:hypothetical protein
VLQKVTPRRSGATVEVPQPVHNGKLQGSVVDNCQRCIACDHICISMQLYKVTIVVEVAPAPNALVFVHIYVVDADVCERPVCLLCASTVCALFA